MANEAAEGKRVADHAYLGWLQTDPRYNQVEAWPEAQFPHATYRYFAECGCLVCALAVMLRHYGIEKTQDEERFNPWVLNERLIACGAFYSDADLELVNVDRLYPIEYMGAMPYSRETFATVAREGLPCLVTVPGVNASTHFLALLGLVGDDAVVYDPLYGQRLLSTYDRVLELRVFRRVVA